MPGNSSNQNRRSTRILGIDPGLNVTGYGVIEQTSSSEFRLVEAGVVRGGSAKREIAARLHHLFNGMRDVVAALRPDVVAMEKLYSHYDRPKTAILMGHARGVLCLAAAEAGLKIHDYPATQIKRVLTGNGRAPKSQMQSAVATMLDLDDPPQPADIADALAIAMCHCFLGRGDPISTAE